MRTVSDLNDYLSSLENVPKEYRVAVGSLIFTDDGKVLLIERGKESRDGVGKLEGVGGGLEAGETDLIKALHREITEELGDITVEIVKPYSIQILPGENYPLWVVVNFLCRLKSGTPVIQEPTKIEKINYLHLHEIDNEKLSVFQNDAMKDYYKQFGNQPFYK